MEQEYLTTIEKEELFTKAFPDIMRAFEEEKLAAKPNKKGQFINTGIRGSFIVCCHCIICTE